MNKLIVAILLIFASFVLASAAMAGGGAGPSKDLKKGRILSVDAGSRTVIFEDDKTKEKMTLRLPQDMEVDKVPVNRKVLVNLVHQEEHGQGAHEPHALREIKSIEIMFLKMTVGRIIALMAIGAIGGLLSGFIGSGGAFVMTPAMMSLGAPGAVAVASNMCHKFPKAMVGAYKRWKYGQADIKLGLVMAASAIVGVQIGIQIQKFILAAFGGAGSNLYISVVFLIVLVFVGGYVMMDALKLMKSEGQGGEGEVKVGKLAQTMQNLKIPPMITFKAANITISLWVTLPVGILTGMLAATIAVGGFIGVPGLIYVMGVSAVAASATELVIAFVMGCWGSIQWGLAGLIDIRLTVLLLSCSLIGVQLGALGTTYVKDYIIKLVMASTMLIVAVSRGAKVPGYLVDLGWMKPIGEGALAMLNQLSFWSLVTALATAGIIIIISMIKGMTAAKA